MMKRGAWWLLGILAVIIIVIFFFRSGSSKTGTINIYLTDAPARVNVTSIRVTLSDVEVHYTQANNENDTNASTGWKSIVNGPRTYDLIQVKDISTFLGSTEVPAGKYTQIRLNVDNAKATIDGTDYDLAIPSGTIKIVRSFDVVAGQNVTLTLDFNAEDSIVKQGNNQYRMQPTIKLLLNNEPKE
ncbi:DUF4382 domain-containing protein [Candidatus Pacearchaeota archaeon]|nr:DUF4382 domain-containing protein [Candidatus Pacearchaeota archaeon]